MTTSGGNVSGIDFVVRTARIVSSTYQVPEDGGTATFTIVRDPSFSGNINVPVRSVGKAALDSDFTLTPAPDANGEYNLPADVPSLQITVTSLPDAATEGPEDVTLAFELSRALSLVGPVHGTLWIADAETALPRVRLAPVGRSIAENAGTELVRATRFGNLSSPLPLALTTGGSATYGTDYALPGGLNPVIPAGTDFLDIPLQAINDSETEGREKIQINLGNGSYVKDSQNGATLFIADDDIAVVSIAAVDPLATEADTSNTAVFRISRTGDLQDALYIEYNALGTALHGTDYAALKGDVTIPIGEAYADVSIVPIADTFNDEGETVQLWLASHESAYHLGTWQDTASIILGQLPPDPSPEPGPADLFYDTFRRLNSNDADAATAGMSGSLLPLMGLNATYFEGFEGSATTDSIAVENARLRMANGNGMSENGLMHNFVDAAILAAGGFSVQLKVAEINSVATDSANRFAGIAVGLTQAEAAAGQDISTAGSWRGKEGATVGAADFFLELDLDGNVKVWRYGLPLATVPVGSNTGTLTAGFACAGFSTAHTVTVTVFFNDQLVDISPGDPNVATQAFNWTQNSANYIGLSCRASVYVDLDFLAIRTLPMYQALYPLSAFAAGLSGSAAGAFSDADMDGENNFVEWAKGSDMRVAGPSLPVISFAAFEGTTFTFQQRRLANAFSTGVQYPLEYSTNLVEWVPFTPMTVGILPVAGNPACERATLKTAESLTTGKDRFFVRGGVLP